MEVAMSKYLWCLVAYNGYDTEKFIEDDEGFIYSSYDRRLVDILKSRLEVGALDMNVPVDFSYSILNVHLLENIPPQKSRELTLYQATSAKFVGNDTYGFPIVIIYPDDTASNLIPLLPEDVIKAKMKAYQKMWHLKHADVRRDYRKAYYISHKEEYKARNVNYLKNLSPEAKKRINDRHSEWQRSHKEHLNKKQRERTWAKKVAEGKTVNSKAFKLWKEGLK
jgi:hypothetical protein